MGDTHGRGRCPPDRLRPCTRLLLACTYHAPLPTGPEPSAGRASGGVGGMPLAVTPSPGRYVDSPRPHRGLSEPPVSAPPPPAPHAAQSQPNTGLRASVLPSHGHRLSTSRAVGRQSVPRPQRGRARAACQATSHSSPVPFSFLSAPAGCPGCSGWGFSSERGPCSPGRFMPSLRVGVDWDTAGDRDAPLLSHPPGPPWGSGSLG